MGDYNTNTLSERNKTTRLTQELSNIFLFILLPQINKTPNKRKKIVYINRQYLYIYICLDCYNTCNSGVLKFLAQCDHYPIFMRKGSEQPIKNLIIHN